jgi:hypothetical protein
MQTQSLQCFVAQGMGLGMRYLKFTQMLHRDEQRGNSEYRRYYA